MAAWGRGGGVEGGGLEGGIASSSVPSSDIRRYIVTRLLNPNSQVHTRLTFVTDQRLDMQTAAIVIPGQRVGIVQKSSGEDTGLE